MIIKSLLDTDTYKYTMAQLVFHQFPKTQVEYSFTCRNKEVNLAPYKEEIQSEIQNLCQLTLTEEEIAYLKSLNLFKDDFLEYLKTFKLNFNHVYISNENGQLEIRVKGTWLETILFEVFVLSIVNEVYFRRTQPNALLCLAREKLYEKILMIQLYNVECRQKGTPLLQLTDFGTRRRFSSAWQGEVDYILNKEIPNNFVGTSSLYWAMKTKIRPIGTVAHEYFMAFQSLASSLVTSQQEALHCWLKEYPNILGIALTDTYGVDAFIRDFNLDLATRFQGVREDSGDPYVWGDKMLNGYKALNIDPKTKTFVFSDSLDIPKAIDLDKYFTNQVKNSFGIGTNLTNDCGFSALNIVMKMVRCNSKPVCKLSDEPSKAMCEDKDFLQVVKDTFLVKKDVE